MIIDFNKVKYSYEDLVADAKALAKQYKNILHVSIGKSMTIVTLLC